MKPKPQIHLWVEPVEINAAAGHESIYAVNACRAWDVPANGVFMLFFGHEFVGWNRSTVAELLKRKLEARERALVNWYGRSYRHHLDQFELTPAERKHRSGGAGDTSCGD